MTLAVTARVTVKLTILSAVQRGRLSSPASVANGCNGKARSHDQRGGSEANHKTTAVGQCFLWRGACRFSSGRDLRNGWKADLSAGSLAPKTATCAHDLYVDGLVGRAFLDQGQEMPPLSLFKLHLSAILNQ